MAERNRRKMDFNQLSYFIAIARYGNFTAAAKAFFVSQPCISHQIQSLEKELGVRLFIRNTRSVELTAAGEIFLEDAKKMVDLMERAKNRLLQNDGDSMRLSVAHLASPSHLFLPAVIRRFRQQHPYVQVRMNRMDAYGIVGAASQHRYDIYCSMAMDLSAIPELTTKSILADHYCLVTPKDHPAISSVAIDYFKLASEPFVFFNPDHAVVMHRQIMQICAKLGFTPRITGTYNLYEDLLYAVEAGMGITILPYSTKNYLNGNLSYTLLDVSNISANLALAWEKDIVNPAVPLFLDVFRTYMREYPEIFA